MKIMELLKLEDIYKFTPEVLEYYKILSPEIPEFILEYANTKEMLKQQYICVSCWTNYSKLFNIHWFSSLEHSIGVALIIWNFTKDKKQTLSWLFHDIATPAFKHCIDFMNGDHSRQESTEELTTKFIKESEEISALLERDNISLEEVCDYHIYPIADNDSPRLSSDRLEYTLSNCVFTYHTSDLETIKAIYEDIEIQVNEEWEKELGFKHKELAEKFVALMSEVAVIYIENRTIFSMQFLADVLKIMKEHGEISVEELYSLREIDIIDKIRHSNVTNIRECFEIRENATSIYTDDKEPSWVYRIKQETKRRTINPLVRTNNWYIRLTSISESSKENINKVLSYNMNKYTYLDFDLRRI